MEGKGRDERRGKEGNWKNGRGGKGIRERNGCMYCYPVSQRVDQYLERLTWVQKPKSLSGNPCLSCCKSLISKTKSTFLLFWYKEQESIPLYHSIKTLRSDSQVFLTTLRCFEIVAKNYFQFFISSQTNQYLKRKSRWEILYSLRLSL